MRTGPLTESVGDVDLIKITAHDAQGRRRYEGQVELGKKASFVLWDVERCSTAISNASCLLFHWQTGPSRHTRPDVRLPCPLGVLVACNFPIVGRRCGHCHSFVDREGILHSFLMRLRHGCWICSRCTRYALQNLLCFLVSEGCNATLLIDFWDPFSTDDLCRLWRAPWRHRASPSMAP